MRLMMTLPIWKTTRHCVPASGNRENGVITIIISSTDDTSFSLLHSCEVDAFQGWNEPNASSSNEKRVILLFARSNISDGCVLIQISDTSLSHHREEDPKLLFPSRKKRLATR
jgi:hypothetical protein